jgi:hypothetical protein
MGELEPDRIVTAWIAAQQAKSDRFSHQLVHAPELFTDRISD